MLGKVLTNKLMLIVFSETYGFILIDPDEYSEECFDPASDSFIGTVEASIEVDSNITLYELEAQMKSPYEVAVAGIETGLFSEEEVAEYLAENVQDLRNLFYMVRRGELSNANFIC